MSILDTSYKSILKLSLPIIFGAFVQTLVLFVDSYYLSSYSNSAFIAAGLASLPYITFYMLGNGLGDAGQIFMARQYGNGKTEELRKAFQSNLINLIGISVLLVGLVLIIKTYFLPDMINDPAVRKDSVDYLNIRAYGFFFSLISVGITSFFIATGRSTIVLFNTIILCGTNMFFDYGLIFGNMGMPRMGAEGAALATVIAELAVTIFSILYLLLDKNEISKGILSGIAYTKSVSKRIFLMAGPLMAQGFMSVMAWTAFFFMIEYMGVHEMEVSRILHNLYWIALIPMFGFMASTRTYVSNLLAEGDMPKIKETVRKLMFINYIFIIICIHGFIMYPEFWIRLVDANASIPVVLDATQILAYLTLSILIHGAAGIYQNVISGSGNTKVAFKMELISILLYLTFAYIVIFEAEWGIRYIWLSEFAYFTPFLILTYIYYRRNKWQKQSI